jgi:acetyl esterase/lipase
MLPLAVMGCGASDDVVSVPPPVVVKSDADQTVNYREGLAMDLYLPRSGKGPFPAVLLLHGGGWSMGHRSEMAGIARVFATEGFVAATADYRLAPAHLWPAQRQDVFDAVDYLRAHARELGILPQAIGAAGVSAGGHLSAILGTAQKVQAVGSISGIHDFSAPMTPDGDRYGIIERLLGETERDEAKRREASPLTYVDGTSAPTMFVCGGKDPLVPRSQSEGMAKALKAAKVKTEILDVPDMGHVPNVDKPDDAEAMRSLARWMHSPSSFSRGR